MMRTRWILFAFMTTALAAAAPSGAQTITKQILCDFYHPLVWPIGIPAVHDGVAAVIGYDQVDGSYGMFAMPSDGTGTPTEVIESGVTLIPNATDGSTFGVFGQASIYRGEVGLSGARNAFVGYHQGIYTVSEAGGAVSTLLDAWETGTPKPANVAIGAEGVAFQLAPSFAEPPAFLPHGGAPILIANPQEFGPGGGKYLTFENLSYGPGIVLYSGYVEQPVGSGGLYEYDIASGERRLVVDGNTTVPGESFTFDFIYQMDTDGENIAFVGKGPGSVGFGAEGGVFVTPVGANGAGPIATIARSGDPAPGGGTLRWFDTVAIEGDLVLFQGVTGHPVEGTPSAIYGCRIGGTPFRVIGPGDVVDGRVVTYVFLHWRGLDGTEVVVSGQYADDGPLGYQTAVYRLTIESDDPASVESTDSAAPLRLVVSPNPVEDLATLRLVLPDSAPLRVSMFGPTGRLVRSLYQGPAERGERLLTWDGRDDGGRLLPAGAYFARIEQGRSRSTERIVIVR